MYSRRNLPSPPQARDRTRWYAALPSCSPLRVSSTPMEYFQLLQHEQSTLTRTLGTCSYLGLKPGGSGLGRASMSSLTVSTQFTLALNLTPHHQRTSRILGSSSQSASFLPGDCIPSSPGNPCLPFPKELRARPHTLDLDLLSDNRRWAETIQNNRHPMKSRD